MQNSGVGKVCESKDFHADLSKQTDGPATAAGSGSVARVCFIYRHFATAASVHHSGNDRTIRYTLTLDGNTSAAQQALNRNSRRAH